MDENEPPRVLTVDAPTPSTDDEDPSDFEIIQIDRSKTMETSLRRDGKLIRSFA